MSNRPWMPLYIADYLADTSHLNAAQSGAYLHLIMHYWQHGALPDNDAALARIARLTAAEWKREREVLAAFFHDEWRHARIDEELAHAEQVSSKRRAAAKQKHSNSSANAEQKHTHARASSQSHSSVPDGTGASRAAEGTLDPKTILFRDGLTALAALTNRSPETLRPILGRWLKRTGDDCGAILAEIERCRGSPVADPIAWIEARLKPRDPNGKPRRVSTAEQSVTAMGSALEKFRRQQQREADAAFERDGDGGPGTRSGAPVPALAGPRGYGPA